MGNAAIDGGAIAQQPIVLKFGSSVLRDAHSLPRVVTELYRHIRAGRKVVAIVSAFAGETDKLLEEAKRECAGSLSPHAPALIGVGEAKAVALLAMACDRTGIDAAPLDVRQLGLRASGPFDDALPEHFTTDVLSDALKNHDVVIVPGYVAIGDHDRTVLLGRGGSDLSAMILAHTLRADGVTLFKSVPGVFEGNGVQSKEDDGDLRIYDRISPETAAKHADALIQEKALGYAVAQDLTVQIASLGSASGVRISKADGDSVPEQITKPVRVGVAGLGVVGEGAVLRLLGDPDHYQVTGILVQNADKKRHEAIDPQLLTTDLSVFMKSNPDIVIDLMSSSDAGADLMHAALREGINIISANKQAVAEDLPAIRAVAEKKGLFVAYGAAVGGGAPMVETVMAARERTEVASIDAVLNGTVNFILSELQRGQTFETALKAAQDAGFAEADPSADLSGDDARAKAAILAYEAFGVGLSDIDFDIEGLDAEKGADLVNKGGAWRQVTRIRPTRDGRVHVVVAYEKVDEDPFLARLRDEANAVRIILESGDVMAARGRGAGRIPTVESVLGDLGAYRRDYHAQDLT
ncbi:MAG: homoserine dehydrogenase [Pseudomonadota bacterium]